ncbi:MAG TPA: TIR domain-containing protein [Ktedonobacteraceae bacterium]
MSATLELFCCYAHEDQEMLANLKKHLMPLQRQRQIMLWSDTDLQAGVEWEKELYRHLESADIILLLISSDFMNSDYCYSTGMGRAIERHEQGNARVIPILLRPAFWRNAPFAKLRVLPTNATPVTSWPDRDAAFHDITEQITLVFPEVLTRRVQLEPEIQRALFTGDQHLKAQSYEAALACYEHILRLTPANEPARAGRARALSALGKSDTSREAWRPAIHDGSVGKEAPVAPPQANGASGEPQDKSIRQTGQTMQRQPSLSNRGNISINAPVTGNVVGIGHGGTLSVSNGSQNMLPSRDHTALKASLQELFAALGNAGLPMQVQMEAQTSTGLAAQQAEAPTLNVEALAQHLQAVGQSLQRASIMVEEGSRLASAISKLAHLIGPVVGGTRVVAGWFGMRLL